MKQLLESLVGKTTPELTSSNFGVGSVRLELYGTVNISNGAFSKTIEFNTWVEDTMYAPNIKSLMDWDIQDYYDTKLGDIPVDNVSQLRETLNGSGLSTLAKALDFDNKQIGMQIAKGIQESPQFKKLCGKDAIIWDALTEEEQEPYKLQYAIDNYDRINENNTVFNSIVETEEYTDEEGNTRTRKIKPTLAQVKKALKKLKNK